jgi:hypothetical protein
VASKTPQSPTRSNPIEKFFRLYQECAGAVRLESRIGLIAGASPIRRLELSRYVCAMGLVSNLPPHSRVFPVRLDERLVLEKGTVQVG